jgi:hypothetical protein
MVTQRARSRTRDLLAVREQCNEAHHTFRLERFLDVRR